MPPEPMESSNSRHLRWWYFAIPALLVLILGHVGYGRCAGVVWADLTLVGHLELLYQSWQLFVFEFDSTCRSDIHWSLQIARFLAPAVPVTAVIGALLLAFRTRLRLGRLSRIHDHVVICGLGRKGSQLVRDFRNRGKEVVALELEGDNIYVRAAWDLGATVLVGSAGDVSLLRRAAVQRARTIVAICGDDGVNVDIMLKAHQIVQDAPARDRRLRTGYVHVVDLNLCALFRTHEVFADRSDRLEVRIFNIHEASARLLFEEHPLDYQPITAADRRTVQLICIGFGKTGEAVVLQAARMGHFANGHKLRITVVDLAARSKAATYCGRHGGMRDVCEMEFVEGDIADESVMRQVRQRVDDPHTLTSVVVCMNDDSLNLQTALLLRAYLDQLEAPISARMIEVDGLTTLIDHGTGKKALAVHPFGMGSRVCTGRMLEDPDRVRLDKAFHEAARTGRTSLRDQGDDVLWQNLDERHREAFRLQADHLPLMLRSVGRELVAAAEGDDGAGITAEELETLARMEHARRRAGWQLDLANDTPPDGGDVGWKQLDEDVRRTYRSHVEAVPKILAGVGMGIREVGAGA